MFLSFFLFHHYCLCVFLFLETVKVIFRKDLHWQQQGEVQRECFKKKNWGKWCRKFHKQFKGDNSFEFFVLSSSGYFDGTAVWKQMHYLLHFSDHMWMLVATKGYQLLEFCEASHQLLNLWLIIHLVLIFKASFGSI